MHNEHYVTLSEDRDGDAAGAIWLRCVGWFMYYT